jgi:hypothetical protein
MAALTEVGKAFIRAQSTAPGDSVERTLTSLGAGSLQPILKAAKAAGLTIRGAA